MTERQGKISLPLLLDILFGEAMNLSSVTTKDQALLAGHIRALFRPRYHCEKQLKELKFKNKRADETYVENYKRSRGCGRVVNYLVDRIGNVEYYTCLCGIKHPLTGDLLSLSKHFNNGILPFKGSLMEQPAQIVELLEFVDTCRTEEEIEIQKKSLKGNKKHGK